MKRKASVLVLVLVFLAVGSLLVAGPMVNRGRATQTAPAATAAYGRRAQQAPRAATMQRDLQTQRQQALQQELNRSETMDCPCGELLPEGYEPQQLQQRLRDASLGTDPGAAAYQVKRQRLMTQLQDPTLAETGEAVE